MTVLIAVVLLSLAAYNYSDLMLSEYKASDNYHKIAQARAYADSGIHYAMAVLSSPDNLNSILNNNPYDNATVFQGHSISQGGEGSSGYFTIIAPPSLNNTSGGTYQFGVMDEGGKININAMMKTDPSGMQLYNMLMNLPNMTTEIANSIVYWADPKQTPRDGAADGNYYSGMSPPYNCRSGPLESIEELLLVQGVTPQLLFGSDLNRNGYLDMGETNDNNNTPSNVDLGWAAYLTIYSREQAPLDPTTGLALINLNDTTIDLGTMYGSLAAKLGDDMAKYITLYLQGQKQTGNNSQGTLNSYSPNFQIKATTKVKSLFELMTSTKVYDVTTDAKGKSVSKAYTSPLAPGSSQIATLMPMLFQSVFVYPGGKTPAAGVTEFPARINLNTAPQEVLNALTKITGGIKTADVQSIINAQPQFASAETPPEIYATPAWLITEANLKASQLQAMDAYVTTRTQVYRVQSIGFADAQKGQRVRVEAVIDTNAGLPMIRYWRVMDDFGRMKVPTGN